MKNLLISSQMVDIFTKFIKREYYNRNSVCDLMIKSMIDKINDNNINFDNSELNKIENIAIWLLSFDKYFDDYYEKKKKAKLKFWENVYNKNIREDKIVNWTPEEKIKNFKIDTAILEKENCLQICTQILNTSFSNSEKDRLSQLFLKICSYIFRDEDFFLQDKILNFEYENMVNVYFLYLKTTIDLCNKSYKIKVEVNKERKMKKFKG